MIKKKRNLLWIIPLALFLLSPAWKPVVTDFLKPQGGFETNRTVSKKSKTEQAFEMDSVTIALTSNGKKQWRITAQKARTGASDQKIMMEMVKARYIGTERPPTHIDSRKGIYFIDKRHLILSDNVVISRPESNEFLYTDLLHYYEVSKMVVSPGDIKLHGPRFRLQSGRMDYDMTTGGYDFSNRVKIDL